jgi:parallel beta-helix repeat protein
MQLVFDNNHRTMVESKHSGITSMKAQWILTLFWLGRSVVFAVETKPDTKAPVTLTVSAVVNGSYTNIQSAINAAPDGAVIKIGPGTFEECLVIEKPLILEGAGWQSTSLRKKKEPLVSSEAELVRLLGPRLDAAKSESERRAIKEEWQRERMRAVLTIRNTKDVQVRGIRFSNPSPGRMGQFFLEYVVAITNAQAVVEDSAVVGGPGSGILCGTDSDAVIRRCLVAAVWGNGIELGQREGPSRQAQVIDTDVRNCYHIGIMVSSASQHAVIRRCRISGAAWHGIRYDSAAPLIEDNLIFDHARSGIYASGKSTAQVRRNLFYHNEMDAISCWFQNSDLIEENTFVRNQREGIAVLGASSPLLRKNIFYEHVCAVMIGDIGSPDPSKPLAFSRSTNAIRLDQNWFYENQTNCLRSTATTNAHQNPLSTIALEEPTKSVLADPKFKNAETRDFGLADDSPARQAGVGVVTPLAFASPWPIQPEELAMIPEGDTRESRRWKPPHP